MSGGPVEEVPEALRWVPKPDRVVAADGGARLAGVLGVVPDLLVGDLDSVAPGTLSELERLGVATERYEHHTKWETDTELAVLAALRWEPGQIVIIGAIGGRLDHALSNVLLLTHPALVELRVVIVEGHQRLFLAKPGAWNEVRGNSGDLLSLLPFGGSPLGVRTEGLLYPLEGEDLLQGRGRGVSNELVADEVRIWLDSGLLLVVVVGSS
jgi:thiamine pyrophosphokinase